MKKRIFYFLLIVFSAFLMLPGNVKAAPEIDYIETFDANKKFYSETYFTSNSSIRKISDYYYGNYNHNGYSFLPISTVSDSFLIRLSSHDSSSISTNTYNYNLKPGNKYEMILDLRTSSQDAKSPFTYKDIYYKYLTLWSFDKSNEVVYYDFLGDDQVFTNVNFGVTRDVVSGQVHFYFILDFEVTEEIYGFGFKFEPKEETEIEGSIPIMSSTAGIIHTDYYVPIFSSTSFVASDKLLYNRLHFGTVSEFKNLETKLDKPVIPLPDEPPEYDRYDPDGDGIKDYKICNQDNVLDRFSCYFDNFQIFFENIFTRIGIVFKTLIDNIVDFFEWLQDNLSNMNGIFTELGTDPDLSKITDQNGNMPSFGPVSDFISMPVNLLNKYLLLKDKPCNPITIPFGLTGGKETLTYSCIDLKRFLGNDLVTLIDMCICFFFVYQIAMLIVHSFNRLISLEDTMNDLYVPQHAEKGKHGKE